MKPMEIFNILENIKEENEEPKANYHDRVLLCDGLNLFFRNFSVLNTINSQGVHIGGLGGFMRSLGFLINQIKPTAVYVVFDGAGSALNRRNLVPEYKLHRSTQTNIVNWDIFDDVDEENEAKVNQIVRITQYLKCLPIKVISIDKVEADDIIAYYSKSLPKNYNSKVFIVSSDKDFLQLINDDVVVYRPVEKEFYTKKTVKEKFNILSENFILYKTLLGDVSDGVEGIKGLGNKGVFKKFPELSNQILTLDDLFSISTRKLKDHVVYSRIIFEKEKLKQNYRVMDLQNPILDENEKKQLNELVESKNISLDVKSFTQLCNDDGLVSLIKNPEVWVKNSFEELSSFIK
jgi:5'-3' exonuclease